MITGRDPWTVLAGLPAWQVLEIPRPDHDDASAGRDDGGARRAQALTAAFSTGSPLAVGWVREQAGGPVRVICAGPAMAAAEGGDLDVLALPSGARGKRLGDGQAGDLLGVIPHWTRIAAVADVLLAHPAEPGAVRPSLEDGLLSVWLGPFAWLLVAEPADAGTISAMAGEAASVQLKAQGFSSPVAGLAARRAEARHDEFRQAASAGLWRVHLYAGAATEQEAARVSGLLRASFDLAGLPYGLVAGSSVTAPVASRNGARRGPSMLEDPALSWALGAQRRDVPVPEVPAGNPYAAPQRSVSSEEQWPSPVPESPFWASTGLVAALARVPVREVPGVRMVLQPRFDLTPETVTSGPGFVLGEILDWNKVPSGVLSVPAGSVNRHVFVCGATGSGKSQTIRHLLESATCAGIPWLVVEPAKAEYRLMASRLPDTPVITIRPGDLEMPSAGINPLEPAAGFPLQAHADLLRELFLAAFDADEPFPQVLSAGLTRCYEDAGWDLVTSQPAHPDVQPSYPGLGSCRPRRR